MNRGGCFPLPCKSLMTMLRHVLQAAVMFTIMHSLVGFAQPVSVTVQAQRLAALLPDQHPVRIAFIDLSDLARPGVTVVKLSGEVVSSFALPASAYDADWIHWGPGIQYDRPANALWVLFPRVGYTAFALEGRPLTRVPFPSASHQLQILDNGHFVSPYSWDRPADAQVVEVTREGRVAWSWHARDFVNALDIVQSPALGQPQSYTATVSAVKTPGGHYWVALAQRNVIVRVDAEGRVIERHVARERPHTLVVEGESLVGYTLRDPNRVVVRNEACGCMREYPVHEALPGGRRTRSLSLQKVAPGLWFVSGVTGLYLMTDDGDIVWRLRHAALNGRPQGFHAAVVFKSP